MQSRQVPRQRIASEEGVERLQRQRELKVGGTSLKIVTRGVSGTRSRRGKWSSDRAHLVRRLREHAQLIRKVQDCESSNNVSDRGPEHYLRYSEIAIRAKFEMCGESRGPSVHSPWSGTLRATWRSHVSHQACTSGPNSVVQSGLVPPRRAFLSAHCCCLLELAKIRVSFFSPGYHRLAVLERERENARQGTYRMYKYASECSVGSRTRSGSEPSWRRPSSE